VVNFSALVYELFPESLSPVVAFFYLPEQSSQQRKIVYGVPKPSRLSQHIGAIVLDADEIKYMNCEELLAHPILWKVASWGTPRDAALIMRLRSLPTLRDLEKTGRLRGEIREGLISQFPGSDKNPAAWLQGKPLLDVKKFKQYVVEPGETIQDGVFHRPRLEYIYTGPLALIHRSTCEAAFLASGFVAYRNKITGVAGQLDQEDLLKWLVAYINSPLARYYHFLTSTSWAVERGTIIHDEYKDMPFLIPDKDDPRLKKVLELFDQIVDLHSQSEKMLVLNVDATMQEYKNILANLVYDIYGLDKAERHLVHDMVDYEIGFFNWAKQKGRSSKNSIVLAIKRPNVQMLAEYAQTFIEVVNSLLRYQEQTLNAIVYQDDAPLTIVGFELTSLNNTQEVKLFENSSILRETLRSLDKLLLEQRAATLYMRKHVRIYDNSWLYLVRPNEGRFWTRSQARADADSFIVDLLNRSKREIEAFN